MTSLHVRWVLRDARQVGGAERVVRTVSSLLTDRNVRSDVCSWDPAQVAEPRADHPASWLLASSAELIRRRRAARAFAADLRAWLLRNSQAIAVLDPSSLPVGAHLIGTPRWGIHVQWSPDLILNPERHVDHLSVPEPLRPLVAARMRAVRRSNRRLLRAARFVATLSASHTRAMSDVTSAVYEIPNPIETHINTGRRAAQPGDPITISFAGRFAIEKAPDVFLDAVARLSPDAGPFRILMAGAGPLEETIANRVANMQSPPVDLLGWVDEPAALMRGTDVLVLSSRHEAHPLVLVEALAAGCSIVATDAGTGVREILEDGRLGRIVPTDSPDQLASAVEAAANDVRAGVRPDRNAIRRLAAAHEPGHVAELWLAALSRAIECSRDPGKKLPLRKQ